MTSLVGDESLELAARLVDQCQRNDTYRRDLNDKFILSHSYSAGEPLYSQQQRPSSDRNLVSGSADGDYVNLEDLGLRDGREFVSTARKPLPQELLDQFNHMQCNCSMGIFSEISRAWVSIDSDLFVWNFETGTDLAFYDSLTTTILSVGLAKPKPGIFNADIQFLLCIATAVDFIILGAKFTDDRSMLPASDFRNAELNLVPDPFFQLSLDNVVVNDVATTENGRIFLAAKDGCLYEIEYKTGGFFRSTTAKKVNHSKGVMSYLVPSFVSLAFGSEESLEQIVIDESRHILFARTEKGSIQVFDLGPGGNDMTRINSISGDGLQNWATRLAPNIEPSNFKPVVNISPLESSESLALNLIGTTTSGVRFYFSCYQNEFGLFGGGQGGSMTSQESVRPTTLRLVHVRLPPGFSANCMVPRPLNVHLAHSTRDYTVFVSAASEQGDLVWGMSSGNFPFRQTLVETLSQLQSNGRSWVIVERKSKVALHFDSAWKRLWPNSVLPLRPPLISQQHALDVVPIHILSAQGILTLEKLRPLDILKRILSEYGPDSSQAKYFFQMHQNDQACAMCLSIACSSSAQDRLNLAEMAVRALMINGGDPNMAFPSGSVPENPFRNVLDSPIEYRPRLNGSIADYSQLPGSPVQASTPQQSPFGSPVGAFRPMAYNRQLPAVGSQPMLAQQNTAFSSGYASQQSAAGLPRPLTSAVGRELEQSQYGAASPQIEVRYSSRHNGLYLHISRVLGSLWQMQMVTEIKGSSGLMLDSTFTTEELTWFHQQLQSFAEFLKTYSVIPAAGQVMYVDEPRHFGPAGDAPVNKRVLSMMRPEMVESPDQARSMMTKKHRMEALSAERQSLVRMGDLVERAMEVLGLWRILTDHQFRVIAAQLPTDLRHTLQRLSFRALVVNGKDLCADLITCLIRQYLGDLATTDAISARLRSACPKLFTSDDATVAKASEMLQNAKNVENVNYKEEMLSDVLRMFKAVATQIHLPAVCMQFEEAGFYHGVVDLVLCTAEKTDPQNLALSYYKSGRTQSADGEFSQLKQAYLSRATQYKCITDLLDRLLNAAATAKDPRVDPTTASILRDKVVNSVFESSDELGHYALYDWLLEHNLTNKLLQVKSSFLEPYLHLRINEGGSGADKYLDLLWEYYERSGEYTAAAQLLLKLAEKHNVNVNLTQRLNYLARAVVCAKSVNDSSFSAFLQELQDKLEVARLQKMIIDDLSQIKAPGGRNYIREALSRLNADLLDVTTLYSEYAEEFGLSESKLAIVHCAGHYEKELVETLWKEIIDKELVLAKHESAQQRSTRLATKLGSLGKMYYQSSRYYPEDFLIRELHQRAFQNGFSADWLPITATDRMLIPHSLVLEALDNLYKTKEKQNRRAASFTLHSILCILGKIVEDSGKSSPFERRKLCTKAQDVLAGYLVEIETLPESEEITRLKQSFGGIKIRLDRISR